MFANQVQKSFDLHINIALLRFLPLVFAILVANSSGKVRLSLLQTDCKIDLISIIDGAGTRIPKHRDLIAGNTRDIEFAQRINLQSDQFDEFALTSNCIFSIRNLSTPEPYNSFKIHIIRVFFPAPDGPYINKCGKSPLCTCDYKRKRYTINNKVQPSLSTECVFSINK
ncbi:hypothetical protein V1478_006927 [Vespula squamosa]|uniref:ZP domain-containing protein n=1 Tax=Vespula squamosa TaxID=30214 RepID=A0ABD2B1R9_VESSQ